MANFESNLLAIAPLFSFLSSCTWAIGVTIYSRLSEQYSSPAVNFARSMIALPLFCLALFFLSGRDLGVFAQLLTLDSSRWFWFSASIIGSFAVGDTCFLLSTRALGIPAALAIASIYPIWSALAGWVFLGNPVHFFTAIGVVCVVAGTVIVILEGNRKLKGSPASQEKRNYKLGIALALATSFFWALNASALSIANQGLSPVFGSVVRGILSLTFCPIVGLILYKKNFRFIPVKVLASALWAFVLEAFCGSLFFLVGLTYAPLAIAAPLSSLSPVVAVCIAWGMGRERVSPTTTLAILTVVAGIWLLVGVKA